MKRLATITLALTLLGSGCAGQRLTPATPVAAAAMKADAIVVRLNELQATVIQFCGPARTCAPGTIATALADQIVQTTMDLRVTLKAVPAGWEATVKTAWAQARPKFASVTNPAILAAISAVDALMGSI